MRVAVGLVAAGVHDLEVVDVAVGLVEVAVAVVVVAVPHVELGQLAAISSAVRPAAAGPHTHCSPRRWIRNQVFEQTLLAHGNPSLRPYRASLNCTLAQSVTSPSTEYRPEDCLS